MAFKKIIFEDTAAHLSQLSTERGTPNKSAGDLETGKLYGSTDDSAGSGDLDKIVISSSDGFVYIAQSEINTSVSQLNIDESSLIGTSWNGGSPVTIKLATASIAGNGLTASTTPGEILVKVKGDDGALNNIDLSSSGIKVSSSIVDSSNPKGLQFDSTDGLQIKRGENISLVNGGELSVSTTFTGFANGLISGSTSGINITSDLRNDTDLGYDGTDVGNAVVVAADLDVPSKGIIAVSGELAVHTASLSDDQLFQWGGSTGQLSGSAISEEIDAISIAKNVSIPGTASVGGNFQVDGTSTNITVKDPLIMLNSGGGNSDFGFNGDNDTAKFGWSYDTSEGRWAFTSGSADGMNAVIGHSVVVKTGIAPSAADSSIQKNGNMVINNEECFIYAG